MQSTEEFSVIIPGSDATQHRVSMGWTSSGILRAEPFRPVIVFGPQRSGKTTGVVIPAVLEWDGPCFVTSVRFDVIESTLKRRQELGRTFIFDPTGLATTKFDCCVGWSPLDGISGWDDAVRRASGLAEGISGQSVEEGAFWTSQARMFLAPLLVVAVHANRSMGDICRWLSLSPDGMRSEVSACLNGKITEREDESAQVGGYLVTPPLDWPRSEESTETVASRIAELREETRQGFDRIQARLERIVKPSDVERHVEGVSTDLWPPTSDLEGQAGERGAGTVEADDLSRSWELIAAFCDYPDRQYQGVVAVALSMLEVFTYKSIERSCQGGSFHLSDFLNGDSNTLYACAPASEQRLFRPLFTALAREILTRAYNHDAVRQADGLGLDLMVCLDEAGNIARLEDLDVIATTAAGSGIQLVSVFHDMSQLKAGYGNERAALIANNHSAMLFLSGNRDSETNNFLASMLQGENVRGLNHRGWTFADLRKLERNKALCVYGQLSPVLMELRQSFRDKTLMAMQ